MKYSLTSNPMTPEDRATKGTIRAYIIAALVDHGIHATDSFKDELSSAIFSFVSRRVPVETKAHGCTHWAACQTPDICKPIRNGPCGIRGNHAETLAQLDADFFAALDRCDTKEPLQVYDSNSWRRVGLASRHKDVVYPERQRPDGHLNIANTGVLRAMVAAFNAMLARRSAEETTAPREGIRPTTLDPTRSWAEQMNASAEKAWEPTTVEILEYARRYSLSTEEARKLLKAERASMIGAVKTKVIPCVWQSGCKNHRICDEMGCCQQLGAENGTGEICP